MTVDARQFLIVDAAVRDAIAGVMSGTLPPDLAVAVAVARIVGSGGDSEADLPAAERPAAARQRRNTEAMAMLADLEQQGKARAAAAIVARRLATNPRDPAEVEALAKHLRRLRRRHKEKGAVRVRGAPKCLG